MSWVFGRQSPDTALLRFIAHHFPYTATCLDIGSGSGANARELFVRGNRVFSIDKDPLAPVPNPETPAWHSCSDILEYQTSGPFDLIYDVNTLCHVREPPFEKIKGWLKPKGRFFSICPTNMSPRYIEDGKDFTRRADEYDVRRMLLPFSSVTIYFRCEPDFRTPSGLESWVVDATP